MIDRLIAPKLQDLAKQFRVVAVLGPRQSGKTTLTRLAFPNHYYLNLENPDTKLLAITDPRKFLTAYDQYPGVIIDEMQEVPELFSYMQGIVDAAYRPGFFIITGSQNFLMLEKITQTLAGRIALLTLLPLSVQELSNAQQAPKTLDALFVKGLYPHVYDQPVNPTEWFINYTKTYLERDVRQIINIGDLNTFQRFVKLCAARVGQLLNYSSLATDCGISVNTAKSWISILEASYIIFLLQPHHKNWGKRLVKSPKLYFYDPGLICSLLGINSPEMLNTHYIRGQLFESFILSEFLKAYYSIGAQPDIYFWCDKTGHEVDCIVEHGELLVPVEIKSSSTVNQRFFEWLAVWNKLAGADTNNGYVVYAGDEKQQWPGGTVVSWRTAADIIFSTVGNKK